MLAVTEALQQLDPALRHQGHLRWVDMITSRLRHIEERQFSPKAKDDGLARVRYVAVAGVEWLKRVGFPPQTATEHVLRTLNRERAFLSVHGSKLTKTQLGNWRHRWLPDQPLPGSPEKANSSVPASIDLVRAVETGLSGMGRPPLEAVEIAISAVVRDYLPPPKSK